MKILLVNKFHYKKGGSETYYFTLAETLKKMGHDVIFFAMQDEKNIECEQNKYFVPNVGVNAGVKGKVRMILTMNNSRTSYKNMKKLIEDERPDLAIFNLVHKQITLSIIDALKEKNIPIFWTMHDLITVCPAYTMLDGNNKVCEKCLCNGFKECINNNCIKNSKLMSVLSTREAEYIKKKEWYNDIDLYICPSNFYKEILQRGNFTTSKIIHMKNPLPPETKYEVKKSKDYVLYFGRLSKEKGVATLFDAMKDVDYKLIVLGTGPIESELKQKIADEHLEDKISMLGFKTGKELTDYVSQARCVILPSEWYENGPYSAMEAMATGRPLIASNIGGLPELVENEVNGYIFKPNNAKDLSEKINKIINLKNKDYEKMCEESCKIAKKAFNPEDYCKDIIKKYERLKKNNHEKR